MNIIGLLEELRLGNGSMDAGALGNTALSKIVEIGRVIALVVAVFAIVVVAVTLIAAKRQEVRTDAMTRVLYIAIGVAIVSFSLSIVGFMANTFKDPGSGTIVIPTVISQNI